jgi:hypothetical protein
MAKESCTSCERRLPEPVAFCPSCDQPTRHATDADRVDWDVRTWRAHVDRSFAAGVNPGTAVMVAEAPVERIVAASTAPAPVSLPRPERVLYVVAPRVEVEPAVVPAPAEPRKKPRRSRRGRTADEPVIDLDRDHEFAYRACVTCHANDWVVRTSRNDDETWNYWCVRCSRAFKTEIRIPQALKPFLSAGVVLGGITAASLLILR